MARGSSVPLPPIALGGNARTAVVNSNSDIRAPSLGAVISNAAENMSDMVAADNVRRDRLEQVKQTAAFRNKSIEAMDSLDPLADDYEEQVTNTFASLKDDALSSAKFRTGAARDEFAANIEALTSGNETIAMQKRRGALSDEAIRVRQESEDGVFAAIRQDPDGYDMYLAGFQDDAKKLNISIKPQLLPKMNEAFADSAILARSQGYAEAGRYDDARKFLEENQGSLDPNVFVNAKRGIREIENTHKQQFLSDTASQVADLEVRVVDATDGSTLSKLRAQVDTLNAQGFFKGREEKRVGIIKLIEAQRDQLINKSRNTNAALDNFLSGTGVDSQKQADLAFAPTYDAWQKAHPDASTEEELSFAADFTAKSGFLPTKYKRLVENAERTENPQLLEAGARIYDKIGVAAPNAKTGADEKDSRVRLTSVATSLLGIGYDQAADMVIKRVPDSATLKARREQFDKDFSKLDMRDMLDSLDIFDNPKSVPDTVARDAERSLRMHYDMIGDKTLATAAMKDQITKTYGVTTVGGVEQAMKYPPERFNPIPPRAAAEMDADAFSKMLTADVRRLLEGADIAPATLTVGELDMARGKVVGYEKSGKAIVEGGDTDKWAKTKNGVPSYGLASDDVTERDIAAGRLPSYEVRVRNSYGLLVPIGKRYRMPSLDELSQTPEYQEVVGQQAKKAADRKNVEESNTKRRKAGVSLRGN